MGSNRILFVCDFYPNKYKPFEGVFFRHHAQVLSGLGSVRVQTLIRLNRFGYERWRDDRVEVEAFIMPYRIGMGVIFLPQFIMFVKNLLFFKPTRVILHMSIPHGLAFIWFYKKFYVVEHSDRIWKGYKKFLSSLVFKSSRKVASVSKWHRGMLKKVFGIDTYVLGNPLPYIPVDAKYNPKRIIFVGTITENKNPIILLKCAEILKNWEFVFIGRNFNDEYYFKFSKILKNLRNVKYLGAKPHSEVLEEIRRSGILVSTSMRETFGYAILEALALGKPVVWFDSGGPRDFLNIKNSIFVRKNLELYLLCGIVMAVEHLERKKFNPKQIRDEVYKMYGFEIIAGKYREFLDL